MERVSLCLAVAFVGALVGMKVALEARLGARPIEVPTNDDILASELTASYPMLAPPADWAIPVGVLTGAVVALGITFVVLRRWNHEAAPVRHPSQGLLAGQLTAG